MSSSQSNNWVWAVVAWIGVIFFSSTSLASKWAESTFSFLSRELLRRLGPNSSSYGIVHLLADKGFHVSLFLILAILLWITLGKNTNKVWQILGTGFVIGSCSEFLQRFFPDRDPAIRDVLINFGGTTLGVLVCLVLTKLTTRRDRQPLTVGVG
jgi:VanZ family protein